MSWLDVDCACRRFCDGDAEKSAKNVKQRQAAAAFKAIFHLGHLYGLTIFYSRVKLSLMLLKLLYVILT